MADLKLKRITGRNWMKFDRMDLTFPEKGLVLVQGVNTASGGSMASVGSGKTSFGEAICRTLLGITGRFTSAKEYSLDKKGDMYVKLEADFLGKPLVVETGYKCEELSPSGDALRYSYDGKQVQRGLIKQTREDLVKLIGVPPLLAEWTVFIDGANLKFNKLSQSDCVELVMAALRQPPWNTYFDASKAKLGKFRNDMAHNVSDHEQAMAQVTRAQEASNEANEQFASAKETYDAAKASHDEKVAGVKRKISAKQDAVESAQTRMKEIKRKLQKMEEERAASSHKLEIKLNDIDDRIREKKKEREPLSEARDKVWELYTQVKTDHDNYKRAADNCPTCQRPMGKVDPERLKTLAERLELVKGRYDTAKQKLSTQGSALEELEDRRRTVSEEFRAISAKADVQDLSETYEELEEGVSAANTAIQGWQTDINDMASGPSDSAVVEAKTLVRTNKEFLAKAKQRLATVAALLSEDQVMESVMAYWNKAFSPYGVPNMVLREAIKPLNKEAQRISSAMTGGTIDVRFNTVREMASGQEKAQLNIEVDNKLGDKQLAGSSKGEAGLTNFIVSETLSEVGQASRRIGFRWYDEIVPHQDPKVCQSIYAYMKDIADKLGVLVFLVDHNPVAANYAEHTLVVEKRGVPPEVFGSVRWG